MTHQRPGEETVSIRAPTQGATERFARDLAWAAVSIRAPTQGATSPRNTSPPGPCVSIRAPTQGATAEGVRS